MLKCDFIYRCAKLIGHDALSHAVDMKMHLLVCGGPAKYFLELRDAIPDRGGTVVKVLCYKSEGLWFDSRCCHWNF